MIALATMIMLLAVGSIQASGVDTMSEKLDPELLAITEQETVTLDAEEPIQVIIGLAYPLTAADETALSVAGLVIRSRVGDVLTGSIAREHLRALTNVDAVVRVEASRPMAPETLPTE